MLTINCVPRSSLNFLLIRDNMTRNPPFFARAPPPLALAKSGSIVDYKLKPPVIPVMIFPFLGKFFLFPFFFGNLFLRFLWVMHQIFDGISNLKRTTVER